ncbi:MAG: glyceraldehyde-3-phosphate:ferredoxin oxidoreductase, partial [Candidatus Aenigmarchaeota archaeon]|nr:glyceraldehyde-3-phosphate:ferredoxin oxidoreductase [Candidatus Aenigmarchaeota archaeon]
MPADKNILVLDAEKGSYTVEKAPAGSVGPIDVSVHYHLNVLKSYTKDVYDPDNALVFGCGPFAGAKIGGVYRATFFARSPIWKGLFSS